MKRATIPLLSICLLLPFLVAPIFAQEPVVIYVMTDSRELNAEEIAAFETENPDIHVELIDTLAIDVPLTSTLMTALEVGNIPDLVRVQADDMPALVEQGLLLDLTDYFTASSVITFDDISAAANYYKFNDRYYGLPKDWSLDFSIYVYTPAFEAAGIPIPSTTEPMTYAELADIARQLTVRDGNAVIDYGLFIPYYERTITSILIQRGISMFNDDYSEIHLTDNPDVLEVIRFFFDLTMEGVLNPDRSHMERAWTSYLPMFQWGYWYAGSISEANLMYGQLTMLPAPTWDSTLPRLNTTIGPSGLTITAASSHPAEAYRFFEWYTAGAGAAERTRHGWGAPALRSYFRLLPQDTLFDQQRFELLISELPYSDWQLPVYPYESIANTFNPSWERNIALALQGEIDFDVFVSNLQEEINLAILNEQVASP